MRMSFGHNPAFMVFHLLNYCDFGNMAVCVHTICSASPQALGNLGWVPPGSAFSPWKAARPPSSLTVGPSARRLAAAFIVVGLITS